MGTRPRHAQRVPTRPPVPPPTGRVRVRSVVLTRRPIPDITRNMSSDGVYESVFANRFTHTQRQARFLT